MIKIVSKFSRIGIFRFQVWVTGGQIQGVGIIGKGVQLSQPWPSYPAAVTELQSMLLVEFVFQMYRGKPTETGF